MWLLLRDDRETPALPPGREGRPGRGQRGRSCPPGRGRPRGVISRTGRHGHWDEAGPRVENPIPPLTSSAHPARPPAPRMTPHRPAAWASGLPRSHGPGPLLPKEEHWGRGPRRGLERETREGHRTGRATGRREGRWWQSCGCTQRAAPTIRDPQGARRPGEGTGHRRKPGWREHLAPGTELGAPRGLRTCRWTGRRRVGQTDRRGRLHTKSHTQGRGGPATLGPPGPWGASLLLPVLPQPC